MLRFMTVSALTALALSLAGCGSLQSAIQGTPQWPTVESQPDPIEGFFDMQLASWAEYDTLSFRFRRQATDFGTYRGYKASNDPIDGDYFAYYFKDSEKFPAFRWDTSRQRIHRPTVMSPWTDRVENFMDGLCNRYDGKFYGAWCVSPSDLPIFYFTMDKTELKNEGKVIYAVNVYAPKEMNVAGYSDAKWRAFADSNDFKTAAQFQREEVAWREQQRTNRAMYEAQHGRPARQPVNLLPKPNFRQQTAVGTAAKPILGIVELDKTTISEVASALDKRGCRYTKIHEYELEASAGCFGLPGTPKVLFNAYMDTKEVKTVWLTYNKYEGYRLFDQYVSAFRQSNGAPTLIQDPHTGDKYALWKGNSVVIEVGERNVESTGAVVYRARGAWEKDEMLRRRQHSTTNDMGLL